MSKKKDPKVPSPERKFSEMPAALNAPDIQDYGKQSLSAATDQLNVIIQKVGNVFQERFIKENLPRHSVAKIIGVETLLVQVSWDCSQALLGESSQSRFGESQLWKELRIC